MNPDHQLDMQERDRAEAEQRRVNFEGWHHWHRSLLAALNNQPQRSVKPAATDEIAPRRGR